MMNKKAVVAGHICLDITPKIPPQKSEHIGEILRPGKMVSVGGADVHTGGTVANTGLAMKILGADVTLAGKIGDDEFGDIVRNIMDRYGVADGLIRSCGDHTSYSVVIAVPGLDRIFMHDPGANDTFCFEDLPMDAISEASLFHFGYPTIMKRMYENDGAELCRIMKAVKDMGVATSLDLTSVDANTEAGRADWNKIFTAVLPYVDIFVPSVEELMFMIWRDRYEDICQKAGDDDFTLHTDLDADIIPLARRCLDMGAKIAVIKCGAKGMYYLTAGETGIADVGSRLGLDIPKWSDRSGFEKSFVPERLLSATGAGDVSIAAYLTAILRGFGPEECITYAAAAGACSVSEYDALSGLKSFEEMDGRIKAGWRRN